MIVRTRFAPSPTGYLHIGGARTALFAWAFARHHAGQFLLRIEDTDLERSTPEATTAILESMAWLGLNSDETPVYQSQRLEHYRELAQQLIAKGLAYRCYCSKDRLEKLREAQLAAKEKPRYDGQCRELNLPDNGLPHVIRFRNPLEGRVEFNDLVHGALSFAQTELDDLIIVRSDNMPTYNFAVVVDDAEMRISHVIRGDDHINNTPRQLNLYHALGYAPPQFAHVPMILGPDGSRYSKRHGAVSVMQFSEEGYLPEAMINFLIRLGWSHGDQELFSREEIIQYFDLTKVSKSAASVNLQKLLWINQHYIKTLPTTDIEPLLNHHLTKLHIKTNTGPNLAEVITVLRERAQTINEMAEKAICFYQEPKQFDNTLIEKHVTSDIIPAIQAFSTQLLALNEWTPSTIHQILNNVVTDLGLKLGKLAQPVRIMLTGGVTSPPLDQTIYLIGKGECIKRIDYFMTHHL